MTEETHVANLGKVDHIVVMNLENRSFDHMLGYLSLEGGRGDVDGLRAEFANEHGGQRYPVHHLGTTAISDDPGHSASAIDLQIGGGKMNGFVASFVETLARLGVQDADAGRVMGYYNGADVPVYDHLASEFAICDRWALAAAVTAVIVTATPAGRAFGLASLPGTALLVIAAVTAGVVASAAAGRRAARLGRDL